MAEYATATRSGRYYKLLRPQALPGNLSHEPAPHARRRPTPVDSARLARAPRLMTHDSHPHDELPLVSVVIPAYNCAPYLARAINSALGQTYPNIECIVVDDGSTDETAEVIRSFGTRIRSIRQANAGASAARNAGIAAATGRYIAFLDADDYWLTTKISNQIQVFRAHPDLVLVSCGFAWERPHEQQSQRPHAAPPFQADRVTVFHTLTQLLRNPYLGTPTVVVEADAVKRIGGFDPSLPVAEDIDLYFRLCTDRPYAFLDQPLARFQLRYGSLTTSVRGYADNLLVFDRLESALPELDASDQALLQSRRLAVYQGWISDLLMRGAGSEARRVLKQSRQLGLLPHYRSLYLKSLIAPVMRPLRRVWRAVSVRLKHRPSPTRGGKAT